MKSKKLDKRFWLFAGEYYYPRGGIADFRSVHNTLKEAKDGLKSKYPTGRWHDGSVSYTDSDWAHIVEVTEDGPVLILEKESDGHGQYIWARPEIEKTV